MVEAHIMYTSLDYDTSDMLLKKSIFFKTKNTKIL